MELNEGAYEALRDEDTKGELKFYIFRLYIDLLIWNIDPELREYSYLENMIYHKVGAERILLKDSSLKSYAESILASCYVFAVDKLVKGGVIDIGFPQGKVVFAGDKLVKGGIIERSMLKDDLPETLDGVLELPIQYMKDYCRSLSKNTEGE